MQVCPYCPFGKGTFRDKNFLTWRFISVGASPAEEQGRGYPFTALPALYLSHGDFRCFCIFLQKQRVFILLDGVWFLLSRTFASTFRHRGSNGSIEDSEKATDQAPSCRGVPVSLGKPRASSYCTDRESSGNSTKSRKRRGVDSRNTETEVSCSGVYIFMSLGAVMGT